MSVTQRTPVDVDVKIPLQYSWPPTLAVVETYEDGERERNDYSLWELPEAVMDAYLKFTGVPKRLKEYDSHNDRFPRDVSEYADFGDSSPNVWMCDECADREDSYGDYGYLTTQDACKSSNRRSPSCSHTWQAEESYTNGAEDFEWGVGDPWGVRVEVNGDRSAPVDAIESRELVVTLFEEWDYTSDPVDSTRVNIGEVNESKTLSGSTGGHEWKAEVLQNKDGSIEAHWKLTDGDKQCTSGTKRREKSCSSRSFTRVFPEASAQDGNYVPLDELDADDFPNHPSHFGRISPDTRLQLTSQEMVEEVEKAMMEYYTNL